MILKKEKATVISMILLVLSISTGCGKDKDLGAGAGITEETFTVQESNKEFYPLGFYDTVFLVDDKGEKVAEFHKDKVVEILGMDEEHVYMAAWSDKIVICGGWDAENQRYRLYAVNESSGKCTKLKEFSNPDSPLLPCGVDFYKGDFYFTYDDKELIYSIDDSLEYEVKEADLGWLFDKVGNKNVIRPREDRNISITRLLDEVGYVIVSSESQRDTVMIQKDGTVTELPQIDLNVTHHFLENYDNKGIIYQEHFTDNDGKIYCLKLDTMEENEISEINLGTVLYPMKNGKVYWFSSSEKDKAEDVRSKNIYHVYDVESNTNYVIAETNKLPGTEYEIGFREDLCVCGDNVFIVDFVDDKAKWFRVDKDGDNTLLTDMDLAIKTISPLKYGTVKFEEGTYNCPSCENEICTFYIEYFILSKEYSEHAEDINTDIKEDFTASKTKELEEELEGESSNECEYHTEIDKSNLPNYDTLVTDVDIINDRYLAINIGRTYQFSRCARPVGDSYQLLYDLETGKRLFNKDIFKGSEDEFKKIVAKAIRDFAENEFQEYPGKNLDEVYQAAYENVSVETADLSYYKDYVIIGYNGAGLPYSDYPFCITIPYQDFLGKDTLEID